MELNSGKRWNTNQTYNEAKPTVFKEIDTPKNLVRYLEDASARTKGHKYVYHYTTLPNLIKILRGRHWHLANTKDMNDQLEYKRGDKRRWENIFFSSFMMDSKESIGMWSMYAQPWESGVKIAIPISELRKWAASSPKLLGLKKDHAGSFEVVRDSLKIDGVNAVLGLSSAATQSVDRIAIELSDALIDSMIITASPLFSDSLREKIQAEIERQVKTEKSIFTNRLFIRTICSECENRKHSVSA